MQVDFLVVPDIKSGDIARLAKEYFGLKPESGSLPGPMFLKSIAALSDMPYDANNPGSLLHHLSFGFAVKAPLAEISEIRGHSSLYTLLWPDAVDGDSVLFLSGNLTALRSEVINGCSESSNNAFRAFTTKLMLRLDQQGLGGVFNAYDRKIKPHTNQLLLVKR